MNYNKGKGIKMIEYREEQEITIKKVITSITCNCCGEPIKKVRETEFSSLYSHATIKTSWDYFAEGYFIDGEQHEIHICEKCYANWIKTFKIAPSGFSKCGYYNEDVDEQQEFERWKDSFHNA